MNSASINTPPVRKINLKNTPLEITPYEFTSNDCQLPTEYILTYCKQNNISSYDDLQTTLNELFTSQIRIIDGKGNTKAVAFNTSFLKHLDMISLNVSSKLGLYPPIIPENYKQELLKRKKPNPARFLVLSHILMPNLDYAYLAQNLNSLKYAANAFWSRLEDNLFQQQSFLYLYSEIGGVGKNTFWNFIKVWAEKHNVNYSESSITNSSFVGPEFNRNLVCYIDDMTKSSLKDWPNMNKIIDGQSYKVEVKYSMPYYTKPRCLLIASSNFVPDENNYRRIRNSLIRFSSETFQITDPETQKHFLMKNGSIDFDAYADIVEEWFLSAPPLNYSYDEIAKNCAAINFVDILGNKRYPIFTTMIELLRTYPVNSFTPNGTGFSYISKKLEDKDRYITPDSAANILRTLANAKIIKQVSDNLNLVSKKYDLSPLYENADKILNDEIIYNFGTWDKSASNLVKESIIVHQMLNSFDKSDLITGPDDPLVKTNERLRVQKENICE